MNITLASAAPLALLCGLAACSVASCTTIHDFTEPHEGGRYAVGETASARVGDVMLDGYRYTAAPVAIPSVAIPAASGRSAVRAGARLVARSVENERAYCTPMDSSFACFYDATRSGSFDQVLVSNANFVSAKAPLTPAVPYTMGDGEMARGFKGELIYQGRADNVISLRYRDYSDDLSKPTYEQDLKYTLDPKAPTEVAFRDAKLKVLEADNQTIRYEILSTFAN